MRRVFWIPSVAILVLLDRITKTWASRHLSIGTPQPLIGDAIRLARVHNDGGAFGLLPGNPTLFLAASTAAAVGLIVALLVLRRAHLVLRIGLALVLVGAIGNLVDRATMGYVLDFFEIRGFPVFNLADACITVGAILLALFALFGGGSDRSRRAAHRS